MIPIFVPYVNRPDLLQKAVGSIPIEWQVEIIDNSVGLVPDDIYASIRTPDVPLTFSQSQNWMLKMARKWIYGDESIPFYLFMHSDAEAGEGTVKNLIEMAQRLEDGDRNWAVIFTAYDALAAFNTAAFHAVGGWDPFLEHYCADVDMYRRLRLAGYELIDSGLPVKHEPSQTLKSDPEYRRKVDLMFPCREAYYRAKWGGPAGHETFDVPFGGKQ